MLEKEGILYCYARLAFWLELSLQDKFQYFNRVLLKTLKFCKIINKQASELQQIPQLKETQRDSLNTRLAYSMLAVLPFGFI